MDARLGPRGDEDQHWELFSLETKPVSSVRRYVDGFGNAAHLLTLPGPTRTVEVTTHGVVSLLQDDPFRVPPVLPGPLSVPERVDYVLPSPLVALDAEVPSLAESVVPPSSGDDFRTVQALMALVYTQFTYTPGVTTVSTTVQQAIEERHGVCQDFAHVLIGLCRSLSIPARYVSGYLVPFPKDAGQTPRAGRRSSVRNTQASHAWVEAYVPGYGWRGFDPTNNLVASLNHVKIAIGHDYSDIPPTRGTFRSQAQEALSVEVDVRAL